jgi:hypothetical protein
MSPLPRALLLSWVAALLLGTGCGFSYSYRYPSHHHVTGISFYEVLSPYGDWIVIQPYGRVWRPYRHMVGVDFRPYVTGGRWIYTEYGWVFDTDWEWGWVPFHYGRWLYAGAEGWIWVPDTIWGPAWVEWRAGGGYVGWAPLPPPVVGVQVTPSLWVFVNARDFPDGRHRSRVVIGPREHPATAVIPPRPTHDGHAWYVGPSRDWVSHESSVTVTPRPYRRPESPPSVGTPGGAPPPGQEHGASPGRPPPPGRSGQHGGKD